MTSKSCFKEFLEMVPMLCVFLEALHGTDSCVSPIFGGGFGFDLSSWVGVTTRDGGRDLLSTSLSLDPEVEDSDQEDSSYVRVWWRRGR